MSLLNVLPPTTARDLGWETPPRRRTPRWVWAVAGLTTLLVLVAGGWLVLPAVGVVSGPVRPRIEQDTGLAVDAYGDSGTTFLHYRHGQQVVVSVPVRNRSPFPTTVSGFDPRTERKPLLSLTGLSGLPVRLGPFEQRDVQVTYEFGNCRYWHERGAQIVDTVALTGSTLGREWTQDLALSEPLVVHSQVIGNCPDRTLVRGDDRR